MANYALLIGTKGGKRTLVADGRPVDVRKEFSGLKTKGGGGFEELEVIQKDRGRTRRAKFVTKSKPAAKKSTKADK